MNRTFYEFFAGGGMARLGLGEGWTCLMANDICEKKANCYRENFGATEFKLKDVYSLTTGDMPGHPFLAWASFPCQDLSLAGNRDGLDGDRSGAFWGFWSAIIKLKAERRAPPVLVLENVCGLLTSNGGKDFAELCRALAAASYAFGAVVIDASHFLPQSRPRLFIVAVETSFDLPRDLITQGPADPWHPDSLVSAAAALPLFLKPRWVWWKLPQPPSRKFGLADFIETSDTGVEWHTAAETKALLSLMTAGNRAKIAEARQARTLSVGTIYKRTRVEGGERKQRAEARFDGIAGCLRTPGGGSSRQTVIVVEKTRCRTRLLSVREAARLMGVPDAYRIPANYNDGYQVFGDGLAVPAVAFLGKSIIDPLFEGVSTANRAAAIAAE